MELNNKKLFTLKFVDGKGVFTWNKELLNQHNLTPESFLGLYANMEDVLKNNDVDFNQTPIITFQNNNPLSSIRQFAAELNGDYIIEGHYNRLNSFYDYLKANMPKIENAIELTENKKLKQEALTNAKKEFKVNSEQYNEINEFVSSNEFKQPLLDNENSDQNKYLFNSSQLKNNIANSRIKNAINMGLMNLENSGLSLEEKKQIAPEQYDLLTLIAKGENDKVQVLAQSGMDLNFAGGAALILAGNTNNSLAAHYLLDGGANPSILGEIRFGNACDQEIRNKKIDMVKTNTL